MYIILTVLGLILIAVICVIAAAVKKNALADGIETERMKELSLADIVSFFKRPEVSKELQSSEDLIAVALREKKDDGTSSVMMCVYDKKTSTVKKPLKRIVADKLSEDLLSTFGNKDMIVLH